MNATPPKPQDLVKPNRSMNRKKVKNTGRQVFNMSNHFKLLNCISPKKAKGKEVQPWVMNCTLQGDTDNGTLGAVRECIIDTGCNITAIPFGLVKLLKLQLIPASNMLVTIADGSTYNPLGLVVINVVVADTHTSIRALVSSGDKVLLGLDWMEKVGCVLDISSRKLSITQVDRSTMIIQLISITMRAGTTELNINTADPLAPKPQQRSQFRWTDFINYPRPAKKLHVWDLPKPAQSSPRPQEVHQNSFLLRAQADITIAPHTQKLQACNLAVVCPQDHYIMIEPWKQLTKSPHCLAAHGFYNRDYRAELRVLLANPSMVPVTIHKDQVIAKVSAKPQTDIVKLSILEGADLGIETPATHGLNSYVMIEETETTQLSQEEQEAEAYVFDRIKIHTGLPEWEADQLRKLIRRNLGTFSLGPTDLGRTHVLKHDIITESDLVKQFAYRESKREREVVHEEVKKMLDAGVTRPSYSPWASPVVLVEKKDASTRFYVDYRRLNAVTKKDTYPLPKIDDTLDQLEGANIFSSLDMASGFWQVPLTDAAKEKTAFVCREGLFEFETMPFGLCNATSTFQRLMDVVLGNLRWECALVYVDDVNVCSNTFDKHLTDLQRIFDRLNATGLKLKPAKCSFGMPELLYLGHIISKSGFRPDPAKIQAILAYPNPVHAECVQSFLGLVNHYRKFVPNFAQLVLPLYRLLKKGVSFRWTPVEQTTFDQLKRALTTSPVLIYSNFDSPFLLQTDASNDTVGAILSQVKDDHEQVVAYASRTMLKAEKNYAITNKEGLALIFAIKHFCPYQHGSHFTVEMDHAPLKALRTSRDLTGRLARWTLVLQSYDCTILYKPGRLHGNVDALTRVAPLASKPYSKFSDLPTDTGGDETPLMLVPSAPHQHQA